MEELEELQQEAADVFIATIAGMERFKNNKLFYGVYKTLLNNNLYNSLAIKNKLKITPIPFFTSLLTDMHIY